MNDLTESSPKHQPKRYQLSDPPRIGHWWAREKKRDEQGRLCRVEIVYVDRKSFTEFIDGGIRWWYGPAFIKTTWSRRKQSPRNYELIERIEMPPHIKIIDEQHYTKPPEPIQTKPQEGKT